VLEGTQNPPGAVAGAVGIHHNKDLSGVPADVREPREPNVLVSGLAPQEIPHRFDVAENVETFRNILRVGLIFDHPSREVNKPWAMGQEQRSRVSASRIFADEEKVEKGLIEWQCSAYGKSWF